MSIFRKHPKDSPPGLPSGRSEGYSAVNECNFVIASIAKKADQNKGKARRSAALLTASTALVPVSLLVAEALGNSGFWPFFFGRLLPGFLAAFAAVLARWIQVEQPHQRWTLYRRWQRLFEAERLRYRERIGRYEGENRDQLLAAYLADGQVQLDEEWSSLIPQSRVFTDEEATP
jgi:hypothetical protein